MIRFRSCVAVAATLCRPSETRKARCAGPPFAPIPASTQALGGAGFDIVSRYKIASGDTATVRVKVRTRALRSTKANRVKVRAATWSTDATRKKWKPQRTLTLLRQGAGRYAL